MHNQLRKEDFTQEELEKCEKDPVYFYNTYWKVFDQHGNEIPKREVTQREYDAIVANANRIRHGSHLPSEICTYPLLPSEMFFKPIK